MAKDAYITNAIVQPSIQPEEAVDEGPVPVPHHPDKPGGTMGDKIGR